MKDEILQLRSIGFTYKQIKNKLGCSLSTISYHLGTNQKEMSKKRQYRYRSCQHPYYMKMLKFCQESCLPKGRKARCTIEKLIFYKIRFFCTSKIGSRAMARKYEKPTFTAQDVINKFGEKPICYLTGKEIDIYNPRSYVFDHIHPASRGGKNTLENLGICTKQANASKTDMTYDEFIDFCKLVIENANKRNRTDKS
jgi:hypothetical protein